MTYSSWMPRLPKKLSEPARSLSSLRRAGGTVVYRYDDTNPEGRTARMLADRAVQQAAGRVDPVASSDRLMRESGSRYIDFLIPGLLGMNLMGSAIWGMGFAIVDARRKKLMKRLIATPMPRYYYLLSFVLSRLLLLVVEVGVLFGLRRFGIPGPGPRFAAGSRGALRFGFALFQRLGTADRLTRADDRSRFRPDELGDDADVDRLRCVLFGATISGHAAADDQGASVDRGDRRVAREHASGRELAGVAPQLAVLGAWLMVCFTLALKLFRWR